MSIKMKKIIVFLFMIVVTVATFGQSLQTNNIIGLHAFSLNLDPDVTFNQYKDFFTRKYIPELDKHYPDVKHYFVEGNRGENRNLIGLIVVFGSQEVKNKYYNEDGSRTELTKTLQERIQPIRDELDKLGTVTAEYTEWMVQ